MANLGARKYDLSIPSESSGIHNDVQNQQCGAKELLEATRGTNWCPRARPKRPRLHLERSGIDFGTLSAWVFMIY